MVFFTCNHCGESVKKPAVEKHYSFKCRGAPKNVSCMDCLKDFRGEEYVAHTKCITEAEKYSGKDYVHKESKNSGAKKQESWMDIVRSILENTEYNLSAQARSAFQRLQSYDNVPRKKAKFQNFVSNCMRMGRPQAEEVWNVLEKELEKMKEVKQQEAAAAKAAQEAAKAAKTAVETNGDSKAAENGKASKRTAAATNGDSEAPVKKSKKQKSEDPAPQPAPAAEEDQPEFEWAAALKKIVNKHEEGISLEKLKKKVLKKYSSKLSLTELTEKQQKKFEKKFAKNLKRCSDLQLKDDVVKSC